MNDLMLLTVDEEDSSGTERTTLRTYSEVESGADWEETLSVVRWADPVLRDSHLLDLGASDVVPGGLLVAGRVTSTNSPLAWVFPGDLEGEQTESEAVVTLHSDSPYNYDYASVSEADFDGDGRADLLVSTTGNWSSEGPGAAYILFGPLSGAVTIEDEAFGLLEGSTPPFSLCETDGCDHPGSVFGMATAAGDLSGDGYPDIVIGAPGEEQDTSSNLKGPGAVFIWEGGPGIY